MKTLNLQRALVVFSGGQDSTTCLWWALKNYQHVEALSFDYGQRHLIELQAAQKIAKMANIPWHLLKLDMLAALGGNTLVDKEIQLTCDKGDDGLPQTFVPGRNLLFLITAAALAYKIDCGVLVTGVCQTDFSGYPDCREETIKSLETSIQKGMECDLSIKTPLMHLTKAQTIQLARDLGALGILGHTHTCYEGNHPPCGRCDACLLRAKGFKEAGVVDPLLS